MLEALQLLPQPTRLRRAMASLGLGKALLPQARGSALQTPSTDECNASVRQARAGARSKASKAQRRSGAPGIERSSDGAPGARQALRRGGTRKQQYDAVDNEILSVLGGPGLLPIPGSQQNGDSSAEDGGADSVSQLAKRLADLLSDSPLPGEVPVQKARRTETAALRASPSPPPNVDAGRNAAAPAGEASPPPAPAQTPAGDPLGKKVLGKAAVQWLAQGAALLAAEVASREAAGEEGLPGVRTSGDLIQVAQQYMRRRAMPRGMQHKCELGLMHFPTVWDHVQRELQRALQAQQGASKAGDGSSQGRLPGSEDPSGDRRGTPVETGAQLVLDTASLTAENAASQTQEKTAAAWMDSPSWLLLKQLARSDEYKKATRSPKKPQGATATAGQRMQPWLSAEARAATQQRIQEFVERALGLLEQERKAEVEAAGLASMGASAGVSAPGNGGSRGVAPVAGQEPQQRGTRKLLQLAQPGRLLGQQRSSAVVAPTVLEAETGEELLQGEVEAELEQASAALKGVVAVSSRIGSEGQLLLTLAGAGWQPLPPTRLSPGDLVCITVDDPPSALEPVRWKGPGPEVPSAALGGSPREAPSSSWLPPRLRALSSTRLLGRVYRLQAAPAPPGGAQAPGTGPAGAGAAALMVALEGKHQEADAARLFGLRLCVERLQPLVDATTYERNRAALENLRRLGLEERCAARHVVAALFRPLPSSDSLGLPHGAPEEAASAQQAVVLAGGQGPGPAQQGPQGEPGESVEGALFSRGQDPTQPQPLLESVEEALKGMQGGPGFDSSQLAAIQLALQADLPVVAIQGPPGTGKTVVVTEIICRAVKAAASAPGAGGGGTPDTPFLASADVSTGDAPDLASQGGAEGAQGAPERRPRRERSAGSGKVLACAPTNAAVDLLVERLVARGVQVVRVGNPERLSPAAADQSLDSQLERRLGKFRREVARRKADLRADMRACRGDTPMREGLQQMLSKLGRLEKDKEREAVNHILSRAQVVLCTTTGAGEAVVRSMAPFSLVVLDEAGQATEPSSWIPLLLGTRAVLSGDPCQLAPTVISPEASAGGLNVSLIERLFEEALSAPGHPLPASHNGSAAQALAQGAGRAQGGVAGPGTAVLPWVACCMLETQYRMNASIAQWSSDRLYGGRLRAAASVADQLLADLAPIARSALSSAPWLLLDTRSRQGTLQDLCQEAPDPYASGSLLNEGEAEVVVRHVAALLQAGLKPSEIAVQSPYQAQVQLIRSRLQDLAATAAGASTAEALGLGGGPASGWQPRPAVLEGAAEVEVATVDSFQGREAEAVVISMVRSNPLGTVGFLGDRRRLNVAVTRARRQVAVVCDSTTVSRNSFLRSLLLHIRKSGLVYSAADAVALYASES